MGTMILEPYLTELWSLAGLNGDPVDVAHEWEAHYSGPGRYHHTAYHIKEGMDFLWNPEFCAECDGPIYVKAAWLAHDLILTPGEVIEANELQSASEAAVVYQRAGFTTEQVYGIITPLIVSTRHSIMLANPDSNARVIRDMDLWVLGQPRLRYEKYASDIAMEWIGSGVVTPEEFRLGRIDFLKKNMLNPKKGRIFYTGFCRKQFEEAAMGNIRWEIGVLESGKLI